jgi:hypothetical protein
MGATLTLDICFSQYGQIVMEFLSDFPRRHGRDFLLHSNIRRARRWENSPDTLPGVLVLTVPGRLVRDCLYLGLLAGPISAYSCRGVPKDWSVIAARLCRGNEIWYWLEWPEICPIYLRLRHIGASRQGQTYDSYMEEKRDFHILLIRHAGVPFRPYYRRQLGDRYTTLPTTMQCPRRQR